MDLEIQAHCANFFRFAFLTHIQFPQTLGAVGLAVDNINDDPSILPNTILEAEFQVLYSECSALIAFQIWGEGLATLVGAQAKARDGELVPPGQSRGREGGREVRQGATTRL